MSNLNHFLCNSNILFIGGDGRDYDLLLVTVRFVCEDDRAIFMVCGGGDIYHRGATLFSLGAMFLRGGGDRDLFEVVGCSGEVEVLPGSARKGYCVSYNFDGGECIVLNEMARNGGRYS